MAEKKEVIANDKDQVSSPKLTTKQQQAGGGKKDKTKYQAFKSDDDESSENNEETDFSLRGRRKAKKERSNTSFKVKMINIKGKKKEKDKEGEKEKQKEKKKKQKKAASSDDIAAESPDLPLHEAIFGVSLDIAVERSAFPDKIELPRIVRECIIYVEEKGLIEEGLYRVSGVKSRVEHLKQLFNEGRNINLEDYDPNCVASLLKLYLRELPSNILTTRLAPIFDAYISCENESEQLSKYLQLIHDLPCSNRTLLSWLFTHFSHVLEKSSENKMNIQNLSIVFSPTMSVSHGVLNLFFQFTKDLFPNVQLLKYVPAEEGDDDESTADSIEDLQKLLQQNEEILNELHGRVNKGEENNDKLMDDLWERQRKSTQIKRKIKELKKLEKLQRAEEAKSSTILSQGQSEIKTTDPVQSENVPVASKLNPVATAIDPVAQKTDPVDTKTTTVATPSNTPSQIVIREDRSGHLGDNNPAETDQVIFETTTIKEKEFKVINSKPEKKNKPDRASKKKAWNVEIVLEKPKDQINNVESEAVIPMIAEDRDNSVMVDTSVSNSMIDNSNQRENNIDETLTDFNEHEELKLLLLEEQRLLFENEELQAVNEYLINEINVEKDQIQTLKEKLEESNKTNSSSSSTSSSKSSSRVSLNSLNEIEQVESNSEDMIELEIMLKQLEDENKKLEDNSNDMIMKIYQEKQQCVQLKTKLRMYELTCAVK